jgi:hypothetical protein
LKLPRQITLTAKGVNGAFVTGDIDGAVEVSGINGRVQIGSAVGRATFKGINGNMVVGLKKARSGWRDVERHQRKYRIAARVRM